jgi:hypothetical protein
MNRPEVYGTQVSTIPLLYFGNIGGCPTQRGPVSSTGPTLCQLHIRSIPESMRLIKETLGVIMLGVECLDPALISDG